MTSDPVGESDEFLEVGGDEQDTAMPAVPRPTNFIPHGGLGSHIDPARRVCCHEHSRFGDQIAADLRPISVDYHLRGQTPGWSRRV
jgi:hypothetical protein